MHKYLIHAKLVKSTYKQKEEEIIKTYSNKQSPIPTSIPYQDVCTKLLESKQFRPKVSPNELFMFSELCILQFHSSDIMP